MLVQLVILVFLNIILADRIPKPSYDVNDYRVVGHHFEKFIKEHNKQYSKEDKATRFKIFQNNLMEINRLNQDYNLTTYDINKFSDLSHDEWKAFLGHKPTTGKTVCKTLNDPTTKDAPEAWDWRDKGMVSPVKSQDSCGSCWAFSATALMESRYLQIGKKVILSEQQIMDCTKPRATCLSGGDEVLGISWIIEMGGQESEEAYPYENKDDTCRFNKSKVLATASSCRVYSISSEDSLKELLYKEGPLSIAVEALNWKLYHGGILEECTCSNNLDHAVLLVGYGSEGGVDYWVIKNSWGDTYGEKGFIKIKRGHNCNCINNSDWTSKLSVTVP